MEIMNYTWAKLCRHFRALYPDVELPADGCLDEAPTACAAVGMDLGDYIGAPDNYVVHTEGMIYCARGMRGRCQRCPLI